MQGEGGCYPMIFNGHEVKTGFEKKGDISITLELTNEGGREIAITSKVANKYGKSIHETIVKMLDTYSIDNVKLQAQDLSALDFVIMARVDAAIKRALNEKWCES